MTNSAKRRGTDWERHVRVFLRERGLDVESLRQAGTADEGDLVVRTGSGRRFVLEAKNRAKIELSRFVREAVEEANYYRMQRGLDEGSVFGAAVVKVRGKSTGDAYVVMRMDKFADLLKGV